MFRTYGFATLKARQERDGTITLTMVTAGFDGYAGTMYLYPAEARLIADMIYKVAAEGEFDE